MINFDAADFCERRSEEVISFFWRSVHFPLYFFLSFILSYSSNPGHVISDAKL